MIDKLLLEVAGRIEFLCVSACNQPGLGRSEMGERDERRRNDVTPREMHKSTTHNCATAA